MASSRPMGARPMDARHLWPLPLDAGSGQPFGQLWARAAAGRAAVLARGLWVQRPLEAAAPPSGTPRLRDEDGRGSGDVRGHAARGPAGRRFGPDRRRGRPVGGQLVPLRLRVPRQMHPHDADGRGHAAQGSRPGPHGLDRGATAATFRGERRRDAGLGVRCCPRVPHRRHVPLRTGLRNNAAAAVRHGQGVGGPRLGGRSGVRAAQRHMDAHDSRLDRALGRLARHEEPARLRAHLRPVTVGKNAFQRLPPKAHGIVALAG
mmetsp:Transcript_12479/g.35068  ORF Transcript_12479/g.35068 Transcript_12479/m.35068 type:complete len:262 (+) Transcript_12479:173-958(+)